MSSTKSNFNVYLCGPTVYNHVHIGNLRSVIVFDFLVSLWKYFGKKVNFVQNITDIDDKIIEKAMELGLTEAELSQKYILEYFNVLETFNVKKPDKIIKVTEILDKIIDYIVELKYKNFTYFNENGDLVFDASKIANYGVISQQKVHNLYQNNRQTKSVNDFVLWKKTKKGVLFDSPFGLGRPGWHTECSAIIYNHFEKNSVDIHGGGVDLIFPHHENENAQHFALTNESISKKWIRVGFVNFNGKKMSKSIGNIIFAKEFAKKYDPDVLRSIFLSINPSVPINLTDELIQNHQKLITKYKKIYFDWILNPKEIEKSTVEQILLLIEEQKFSNAIFLISNLAKQRKNSEIVFIFKLLRFSFTKKEINSEDQENIQIWKKLLEQKKYEEADKYREKLWKRFIFS
ncbi:cysteine--tRNA ligase [Mesomycoplasma ovipneumoniae]|uniref:cysteine--tRNA ligase n=1 Tax=Mesomycoplasma ovipneumoniae TaxID=29562 RepID=UPI00311B2A4F